MKRTDKGTARVCAHIFRPHKGDESRCPCVYEAVQHILAVGRVLDLREDVGDILKDVFSCMFYLIIETGETENPLYSLR